MSRYTYCDTTDRVFFKVDELSQKELIISEDACNRLNDLERQLAQTREENTELLIELKAHKKQALTVAENIKFQSLKEF